MIELHLWLGGGGEPSAVVVPFALTYLLHSLLWAGAALLLAGRRSLPASKQHLYFKAALFGPLLTSLLATSGAGGLKQALFGPSYVRELAIPWTSSNVPAPASHHRSDGREAAAGSEGPATW